jgi:hypothetical protein
MTSSMRDRAGRASWLAASCVALLCAAGLALRLRGIDFLLPHVLNRDGLVVVRQVELMRAHAERPEQDRLWALYPHLLSRLVMLFPSEGEPPAAEIETRTIDSRGPAPVIAERSSPANADADGSTATHEPITLERALASANAPWVDARIVVALFSILVVPGTYLLARSFLGTISSLFAAGLMATSLFHVHVSTQGKPHAMVASFLLLAIVAAIRLRRRGDAASYLLCGATAGLALASLHDGIAALLPLCAAHLLREKRPGRASGAWILASLAIVALCVRVFYPFHFTGEPLREAPHPEGDGAGISLSGHKVWFGLFNGEGFPRVFGPILSCDPVLLALAIAGATFWIVRFARSSEARRAALRGDLAVALSFALPFLALVTMYAETMGRYAIPILPLLACTSAYGLERLLAAWRPAAPAHASEAKVSSSTTKREIAIAAVLLLVASLPACRLAQIRGEPDTFDLAASAVRAKIDPADRTVIAPYLDLPLFHDETSLAEESQIPWRTIWVEYQARLGSRKRADAEFEISVMPGDRIEARRELYAEPSRYFRAHRAHYAVVPSFEGDVVLAHVRDVLRGRAQLVRRISPLVTDKGLDAEIPPEHLEDEFGYPYALTLFSTERMGPTIEIYELPQ